MAAVMEADAPVTSVKLEGLAALKIIKHCQESLPTMVTGSLLGLMIDDGCLEITHAFPFPEPVDDNRGDVIKSAEEAGVTVDDEAAALDGHEFQLEMMKMLREVNVDNNCVGWYQSMYLGTHSTSSLLENQLAYQADLSPNAVVILYDPMQTAHGNLVLKCYRLTDEVVRLRNSGKNSFIDPRNIFQEVPVTLSNPGLIRALLRDVGDGLHGPYEQNADTTFDRLDLSTNPYLEKHLEFLCSWVDDLAAEQYKFQHYTRSLRNNVDGGGRGKRDRKAKEELAAAIDEGWARDDAPRRMESLLMGNQIRTYCDQVEKFAGGGFGKLYLTKGLHEEEKKSAKASS